MAQQTYYIMKILTKLETFRFDEQTKELLTKIGKYRIKSKFVREAIKIHFEKEYPNWITEQKRKQELIDCPF